MPVGMAAVESFAAAAAASAPGSAFLALF